MKVEKKRSVGWKWGRNEEEKYRKGKQGGR